MRHLFLLIPLAVLAACQSSSFTPQMDVSLVPSIAPSVTLSGDAATPDTPSPTVTSSFDEPLVTPTPLPQSMPSANMFRGLLPKGAKAILGVGVTADVVVSPDTSLICVLTSVGVVVLDAVSLAEVWSVNTGLVHDIVWSPDGTKIAIGEGEKIIVRDALTGEALNVLTLQDIYSEGPYPLFGSPAWSPDNIRLAVGGQEAVVWDSVTSEITTGFGSGYYVDWLGLDRLAVSNFTHDSDSVTVWNVRDATEVSTMIGIVQEWSPDYSLLRTWERDTQEDTVWDVEDGSVITTLSRAASFSPDWTQAAIPNGETVEIRAFRREGIGNTAAEMEVGGTVGFTKWSPDGMRLVVSTQANTQLWNVQSQASICTIEQITLRAVRDVIYANPLVYWLPDGRQFMITLPSSDLTLWSAETCEATQIIQAELHAIPELASTAFVNQGKYLLVDDDSGLRVLDIQAGQAVYELIDSEAGQIGWTEDSRHVIFCGEDTSLLWDIETGMPVEEMPSEMLADCRPKNFHPISPDSSYSIRYGESDELEVVDEVTGKVLARLDVDLHHSGNNGPIIWTPDGRLMAANFYTGLYVWGTQTWTLIGDWHGLDYGAAHLAFSPDEKWIAANVQGAVVVFPVP